MRFSVKAVFFTALACLSINGYALDYYVSPSGSNTDSGTSARPFKTISKAVTVIKAGDQVHVAPGTYAENIYTTVNGTANARIRFISDTLWGAKIVPPSSSTRKTAFDNRGAYVTIDGFEVDGSNRPASGTKWTVGINVGGTGDSVIHCHVHHIYQAATDTGNSAGGAGILLDSWYGFNNMHAHKNIVHHIGPSVGGSWYQGVYQTATGTIRNNIAYRISGFGIHCWHDAQYIDIANNTVFGSGGGVVIGGGDFIRNDTCRYMTVTNNIAFDNLGVGFRELGRCAHNTFMNNLSNKNGTNWLLNVAAHTQDVTGDPGFVNYVKTGGGDYHLNSASPAIDKGVATYAPSTDYDGTARPQGAGYDIGAYEYVSGTTAAQAANPAAGSAFIAAHPNPFNNLLRVWLNDGMSPGVSALTVYDMRGKTVHRAELVKGMHAWHPGALPAGAYLVKIKTASGRIYQTRCALLR